MRETLAEGAFWLYGVLQSWYGLALILIVFLFIPLGLFDKTKRFAGRGLLHSSILFGVGTWFLGAGMALAMAGWFWLIIGLVFMGVGVVPVAIVASALNGRLDIALGLIISVVVTFGVRFLAYYVLGKADEIEQTAAATT